jgi:hypothetical protein
MKIKGLKISRLKMPSKLVSPVHMRQTALVLVSSVASLLISSERVHASGQEAVELMYGSHTNVPYSITWIILLYGAYKMYFGIFRWLASW